MKILYHHRTLADGAEGIHIYEIINAFRELGHIVELIGAEPTLNKIKLRKRSILSIVKNVIIGPMYELAEIAYSMFGLVILLIKGHKFMPDLIYERYMLYNFSGVWAAKILKKTIYLEINAPLALEREKQKDEKLYFPKFAYWTEKKICAMADRIFVVSTPLKEYLEHLEIQKDKIKVLPNGVNTDKFFKHEKSVQLLKKFDIESENIVIGFSGIFRPWHGLDRLLEVFAQLYSKNKNVILLLVGDGPIKNNLIKQAEKLGVNNTVKFSGKVSYEQVAEYINLFDIAVSPKATFYASPMKIPEYMALGKTVVAPDTPNILDLIIHNETGYLFKNNNYDDLYNSLDMLLNDNNLLKKLSENAYKEVQIKMEWTKKISIILEGV